MLLVRSSTVAELDIIPIKNTSDPHLFMICCSLRFRRIRFLKKCVFKSISTPPFRFRSHTLHFLLFYSPCAALAVIFALSNFCAVYCSKEDNVIVGQAQQQIQAEIRENARMIKINK